MMSGRWRMPGLVLAACLGLGAAEVAELSKPGGLAFPNPGLEEDVANIGIPDRWQIGKEVQARLVTDKVTQGAKALRVDSGYGVLTAELQVAEMAGMRLDFSFDAAGSADARLGVMIGYFIRTDKGRKWVTSQPVWNLPLKEDYQTIARTVKVREDALDGRFWFCVYRSNREGTLWLDNFRLTARGASSELSEAQTKQQTELLRELDYAIARRDALQKRGVSLPAEAASLDQLRRQCLSGKAAELSTAQAAWATGALAALLNRAATGSELAVVGVDAWARFDSALPPAAASGKTELIALGGEYCALGVEVANGIAEARTLTVKIAGLEPAAEAVVLRRQVLLANWYRRGAITIADALPPLAAAGAGIWRLPLAPGETVRLHLGFKTRSGIRGDFPVSITVEGAPAVNAVLKLTGAEFPRQVEFGNLQCMYPTLPPASTHPELVARDLAEHYTTMIEFPFMPTVAFHGDGALAPWDLSRTAQARWMRAYGDAGLTMAIFWAGAYERFPNADAPGTYLTYTQKGADGNLRITPEWRRAFDEILAAWLKLAGESGYGDRMAIWAVDEPASKADYAIAPGPGMRLTHEMYRLAHELQPGVPRVMTHGLYTLPADAELILPEVDVYVAHWPQPETLTRWAPPEYRHREAFLDRVLPLLHRERERRGMKLWSYHVEPGKTETVLFERAYPLAAVGLGMTGVGTWAYNVTSGSSWDDTDGKILDYSFVYDGTEKHPLNLQYNPSGEVVVPSLRWEALRSGIQDAKILLRLKSAMAEGRLSAVSAREVKSILDRCEAFGRDPVFNPEEIDRFGAVLRWIYTREQNGL